MDVTTIIEILSLVGIGTMSTLSYFVVQKLRGQNKFKWLSSAGEFFRTVRANLDDRVAGRQKVREFLNEANDAKQAFLSFASKYKNPDSLAYAIRQLGSDDRDSILEELLKTVTEINEGINAYQITLGQIVAKVDKSKALEQLITLLGGIPSNVNTPPVTTYTTRVQVEPPQAAKTTVNINVYEDTANYYVDINGSAKIYTGKALNDFIKANPHLANSIKATKIQP